MPAALPELEFRLSAYYVIGGKRVGLAELEFRGCTAIALRALQSTGTLYPYERSCIVELGSSGNDFRGLDRSQVRALKAAP